MEIDKLSDVGKKAYNLLGLIEDCGASEKLTEASSTCSELINSIEKRIKELEEGRMYEMALSQFTGYIHGKDYDLISMIGSMGLTKKEWSRIKKEPIGIKDSECKEIDEYFRKRGRVI